MFKQYKIILFENDSIKVPMKWNNMKFAILPESENRLYIINSDIYFEFSLNEDGTVNELSVPAQNSTWEKITK